MFKFRFQHRGTKFPWLQPSFFICPLKYFQHYCPQLVIGTLITIKQEIKLSSAIAKFVIISGMVNYVQHKCNYADFFIICQSIKHSPECRKLDSE